MQRRDLLLPPDATRPTDDEQPSPIEPSPCQLMDRAHGDVRSLERLDPSDEEQERRVVGHADRATRLKSVSGREERVVDAWGDDLDLLRHRAVKIDELVDFGL